MGETREHDSGAAVGQATAPPTITGAAIVDYKILEFRIRHPTAGITRRTAKPAPFPSKTCGGSVGLMHVLGEAAKPGLNLTR